MAQSLIRDAESEKFLDDLTSPIFAAAGLNAENIKIYIVNDNEINAFVSGGQNVFINSGLIRKYRKPDTLIGVIAHESGHIVGGHLARSSEGSSEAEGAMILTYLLGIGAFAAGSPDAGSAIIMGGSQTAQRLFTRFTRTQEEAADQYAIRFLQEMSYPVDGLIKLLEFFDAQMIGYKGQIDEFLLSHPVSRKRIDLLKARSANWNFSNKKINDTLQPQMDRVLAKLEGFMENPDLLLAIYKNQFGENANYIKSIAHFRKGQIKESIKLLDAIIIKNQMWFDKNHSAFNENDKTQLGFLYELKGQILFESGMIDESILAYDKAIKLIPQKYVSLAKISFAAAILSLKKDDDDLLKLAIGNLKEAEKFENKMPLLFKYLSDAYNKNHDEGRSYLALAQYNFLINEKEKAQKYAKKAKEKLSKSDKAGLLQADDLLLLSKDEKDKKSGD